MLEDGAVVVPVVETTRTSSLSIWLFIIAPESKSNSTVHNSKTSGDQFLVFWRGIHYIRWIQALKELTISLIKEL